MLCIIWKSEKYSKHSKRFVCFSDSVRQWKQKNKLGEFDPETQQRKEEKERQLIEESAVLAQNIKVKLYNII